MKKTINFVAKSIGHSHEIVQALYACYQSNDVGYCSHIDFAMTNAMDPQAVLNVYLEYMPSDAEDLSEFDLVLYSNGCEPLHVSTEILHKNITTQANCYIISNGKLTDDHQYAEKNIWFPANLLICRDLWTRYFFPQFHAAYQMRKNLKRHKKIIFVNGRNDSWRHNFALLLAKACPEIPHHSTISTSVHELNNSFFESDHDQNFRLTVNEMHRNVIVRNQTIDYNDNQHPIGINGEFGTYPKGYSFMPCYFEYGCVIFPETSWQNDELAITEKILKCFYAGTIPWPLGGSNINRLYNDAGFQTAWNLLPEEYQAFDSDRDHMRRYRDVVKAIKWFESHPEIMQTKQAHDMIALNKERFLTCHPTVDAMQKLHKLLECYMR